MKTVLEVVRGTDADFQLTWTDSDGNPVDITGYTMLFTVKPSGSDAADDSDAVIKKSWTSHEDPANGITVLRITHDDTANLTASSSVSDYEYDIKAIAPDGTITGIEPGYFYLVRNITRRTS